MALWPRRLWASALSHMRNRRPDQIIFENMRDVEGIAFPNSGTGQLDLSYIKMSGTVAPERRLILYNAPLKSQFQK